MHHLATNLFKNYGLFTEQTENTRYEMNGANVCPVCIVSAMTVNGHELNDIINGIKY